MEGVDSCRSIPAACAIAVFVTACVAAPASATFPGRNGSLVLARSDDGGFLGRSTTTLTLNPRTFGERTVRRCDTGPHYEAPRGCLLTGARISPDGRRLALLVTDVALPYATGTFLEILSPRGQVISRVATEKFDGLAWSPDGQSLLASRGEYTSKPGLFLIGLDGRVRRQVAGRGAASPDWSTKGDIAFSRLDGLYVTRLGGPERRIGAGDHPSWSPEGRRLAFRANESVVVARADGRKPRIVSRMGASPEWSPDGRRIALGGVYTVKPNARGLRRLSAGCGFQCGLTVSDWQPLRRRR